MNSQKNELKPFSIGFGNRGRYVLLTVLVMMLFVGTCSIRTPIVLGHEPGRTYQAWAPTPPTINGEIISSEWQTAAAVTFTITIGVDAYPGTLYVMNDATNLYLAVKMADSTFSTDPTPDGVGFYFNNDNGGTFEPGDDGLAYITGATGFLDRYLEVIPTMQKDVDFGGTTDGSAAAAAHGGFNHFEFSHPLDSADDAHDFSLSASDTVGFTMLYLDGPVGQGYWPAVATADATAWGDIVIAASPPTLTAWASTAPTIDGIEGATEWAGASYASFSIGWIFVGDLWVMNDASNLYMAAKIADTSLTPMDKIYFAFDNNNDGTHEVGDDLLGSTGDGTFMDLYWGPPKMLDIDDGGTSDGQGNASGSGGYNYFEMSHPLDSSDDAHDFSLSAGNTIGFSIEYWDEASGYWGDWPSSNTKSWAHITIASAPVPTPDFTISWEGPSLTVSQGASGSTTCTVTSLNAFSAAVDLSGSWVGTAPTGVTFSFATPITPPADGTAASTLLVNAEAGASVGTFMFRITGTSGSITHMTDLQIQIIAGTADFTITANPLSMSLGPGTSGTSMIQVQSTGIFSAPVTLTSSGAPSGLSLVFGTNPVTPPAGGIGSSVLTVTVSGAPPGSYAITIMGTSGTSTRSATLTAQVTTGGGGCMIATATFGSELSDEVQFLRDFRDNSILETRSGSSFMTAFNAWYYSFSPAVAEFIREHPAAQTAAKLFLYPLIGILRAGASAFDAFPENPEAAAIASGLVVSSLVGVTYFAPLTTVMICISPRAHRISRKLQLPTFVLLSFSLATLALTEILGAPAFLMTLGSSTVVLACLIASLLCSSRALAHLVKSS